MRHKLIIALTVSLVAGAAVFALVHEFGNFLVWRYYLEDNTKQERAKQYVDNFQDYVTKNKLSIDDSSAIAKWSAGNYVDIILYKDSNLIYAPDWFEGSTPIDGIIDGPIKDTEFYESWFSGDRGFEKYLTEEARAQYSSALDSILSGNNSLHPVYFVDGTLVATVVDYTEDFMYDLVLITGIVLGLLVITLIMTLSFSSMAMRINKLAKNVRLVEDGNLNMPISIDGNDEITSLASDVNSMRNSVIDNMTKERQAWEANAALVTAMSHDIRTPLTVLMGYLDLIDTEGADTANEEYVAACRENAMRLKHLSDDMFSYLLVFGKSDLTLNPERVIASEAISHIIAEHSLLLSEQGYTIEIEREIPCVTVELDRIYFSRVIDNIFSNIAKYADKDHPVVTDAEIVDGLLILTFENKIRMDKNIPESNGIGIKTCTRIMERMGGTLSVAQDDGHFTATLKVLTKEQNDSFQGA